MIRATDRRGDGDPPPPESTGKYGRRRALAASGGWKRLPPCLVVMDDMLLFRGAPLLVDLLRIGLGSSESLFFLKKEKLIIRKLNSTKFSIKKKSVEMI